MQLLPLGKGTTPSFSRTISVLPCAISISCSSNMSSLYHNISTEPHHIHKTLIPAGAFLWNDLWVVSIHHLFLPTLYLMLQMLLLDRPVSLPWSFWFHLTWPDSSWPLQFSLLLPSETPHSGSLLPRQLILLCQPCPALLVLSNKFLYFFQFLFLHLLLYLVH